MPSSFSVQNPLLMRFPFFCPFCQALRLCDCVWISSSVFLEDWKTGSRPKGLVASKRKIPQRVVVPSVLLGILSLVVRNRRSSFQPAPLQTSRLITESILPLFPNPGPKFLVINPRLRHLHVLKMTPPFLLPPQQQPFPFYRHSLRTYAKV